MSLALLFAAPVFAGGRIERTIRWLFIGAFVLAVAALIWLAQGPGDARSLTGRLMPRPAERPDP